MSSTNANTSSGIPYGIIGTNWITESWVAATKAVPSSPWTLTAVYSREESKAESFAAKTKSPEAAIYTSIEALAADNTVKAVYIASPNSLHYQHAKTCLKAGKHVILEKPATSTSAELQDLFSTADANSVLLIEAYRHLQEPNFIRLAEAVDRGRGLLGRIYGANLQYCNRSSRYEAVLADQDPPPNTFSLDFSGGALVDVGVYPISAAVSLFGRPKAQTYSPMIVGTGVDGGGFAVLRYDDFAVQIACSKTWTSHVPGEIYGENGRIEIDAVADIERVKFFEHKTGKTRVLSGVQEYGTLNLTDESRVIGSLIDGFGTGRFDDAMYARMRQLSLDVLSVTEDLRRQNGIRFAADKY